MINAGVVAALLKRVDVGRTFVSNVARTQMRKITHVRLQLSRQHAAVARTYVMLPYASSAAARCVNEQQLSEVAR